MPAASLGGNTGPHGAQHKPKTAAAANFNDNNNGGSHVMQVPPSPPSTGEEKRADAGLTAQKVEDTLHRIGASQLHNQDASPSSRFAAAADANGNESINLIDDMSRMAVAAAIADDDNSNLPPPIDAAQEDQSQIRVHEITQNQQKQQ